MPTTLLAVGRQLTDANAALFDAANGFAGCIPGIHEILRRQGLLDGTLVPRSPRGALPRPGRRDRPRAPRYPHLTDDAFVRRTWTAGWPELGGAAGDPSSWYEVPPGLAQGRARGVCSCARPIPRGAGGHRAGAVDGSIVLIEATSNQVDQFGGYTGVRPAEFVAFVPARARGGPAADRVVLGGDHLGPNPWHASRRERAMAKARGAGAPLRRGRATRRSTSTRACRSPTTRRAVLDDAIVAEPTADLAPRPRPPQTDGAATRGPDLRHRHRGAGARRSAPRRSSRLDPDAAPMTPADASTARVRRLRRARGWTRAWTGVMALVVQPGVEFGDDDVIDYRRAGRRRAASRSRARGAPGLRGALHGLPDGGRACGPSSTTTARSSRSGPG